MTLAQALSFAIVAGMLGLFLWDRLRFDVVALLALLAAIAAGVVPVKEAFDGFSNPVVIIIASALVLSRAIGASGIADLLLRRVDRFMTTPDREVGLLCLVVTALSALMKNVGTLAIFIPVALRLAERGDNDRRRFLMPMSFASLAGGLMTLIGTSPNLLISGVRQDVLGRPYTMFDFTPVGLPLAALACLFLSFGWRLIPGRRHATGAGKTAETYATELRISEKSSLVGKRVRDFEQLAGDEASVAYIIRGSGNRRMVPARQWPLRAGDILVVEGEAEKLQQTIDAAALELVGSNTMAAAREAAPSDEIVTVEAVVREDSDLVGNTSESLGLRDRYQVNLLALSRRGRRIDHRLSQTPFRVGDLIILEGSIERMPDTLAALGCLALVDRTAALAPRRPAWRPLIVLVAAMVLAATQIIPVQIAFFGAAVATVGGKMLTPREAYEAIDWPVVILLGCLIPVGEAVHTTGGSALIAQGLAQFAGGLPGFGIVALLMLVSMLVTPVLHHAAAVLVMGPIAASLAQLLGDQPDPFLMAVAVGASCDFLTPIGHQCNALVMGPGGYRFGDYWHLGLPLSITVLVVGVPLILLVWPIH